MATNFPTSIDSLTNPASTDSLDTPSHSTQHINSNDAIEAIQAKVGVDNSAVTTSHDYKISQLETDSHSPVTVTDSTEIDFTLTGQEITASLKSGSIDETKLDTSVNASLDLADSALQNVVEDTTPQLGGQLDVNGKALGDGTLELLKFSETASAVNELTIKNNSTGNAPGIQATGDDTNIDLQLTPKGTGIVKGELHTATFVLKDKDTSLATGTSIGGDFRIPGNRPITITKVGAYVDTAGTTGVTTFDINEAGTSILSTKITIDSGEKTSQTAVTAPVISDSVIAADAILTFDIDGISTGTVPKGLKIYVEFKY
jgi:hypothetical protein